MFGRKGQGAMEYLMTYGWAILVVMIVGIVMWQLGIFNPSGTQAVTFQGFGAVKPQLAGTGLDSDGLFTGTFLNAGGAPIQITDCFVTIDEGGSGTVSKTGLAIDADANDHAAVTVPGLTVTGSAGDAFAATVQIGYDVTIGTTTVSKKSSGVIRGSIE